MSQYLAKKDGYLALLSPLSNHRHTYYGGYHQPDNRYYRYMVCSSDSAVYQCSCNRYSDDDDDDDDYDYDGDGDVPLPQYRAPIAYEKKN